jgi:hypothetical protein
MSDEANPNLEPFEPEQSSMDLEPDHASMLLESEPQFDSLTGQAIVQPEVPLVNLAVLEGLSNQLVWKIGKEEGSERVVVRVGYASATGSFRELPKLRGATDTEVADAAKLGELVVEWIE